jgi:hypothetical protein
MDNSYKLMFLSISFSVLFSNHGSSLPYLQQPHHASVTHGIISICSLCLQKKRKKKATPTIGFGMMDVEGGSRVFFWLDPEFLLSLLIRCCLLQASNKLLDRQLI